MILYYGKIYKAEQQNRLLKKLPLDINKTLTNSRLDPMVVINACDKLSSNIIAGQYNHLLYTLDLEPNVIKQHLASAIKFLKKESLLAKMQLELNNMQLYEPYTDTLPFASRTITKCINPLGALFHVAAGNVNGLSACTLVEGLLGGNINILKLSREDKEITFQLLLELIKIEPLLIPYIYVFDTPLQDIKAIKKMALASNAVVTWGNDVILSDIKKLLPTSIKFIEWGHKVSCCYIDITAVNDNMLYDLAMHITITKQLLCSSCQVIYIDTDDLDIIYSFCEKFLPYLEKVYKIYPINHIGAVAQSTIQLYNSNLLLDNNKIFKGYGCSVLAKNDYNLETSFMFGNCLVKRLPREKIVSTLQTYKGSIQTVGLVCHKNDITELTNLLLSASVGCIKSPSEMSAAFSFDALDGDYPLRRYTRITQIEK